MSGFAKHELMVVVDGRHFAAIARNELNACGAKRSGWACSLPVKHSANRHEAWCVAPDERMLTWPVEKRVGRK